MLSGPRSRPPAHPRGHGEWGGAPWQASRPFRPLTPGRRADLAPAPRMAGSRGPPRAGSVPTVSPWFPWHRAPARTKVQMRQHRYLPHVREPSRLNPAAASAPAGAKTRDPHVSHSNSPGSGSTISPPSSARVCSKVGSTRPVLSAQLPCIKPYKNPARPPHLTSPLGWHTPSARAPADSSQSLPGPLLPAQSSFSLFAGMTRAGSCASKQPSPAWW